MRKVPGRTNFNKLDRAITNDQTFGSVKLLTDLDGKILSGHILDANAGDLIAPVVYVLRYGLISNMIAEAILPYPMMAESVRWAAAQLQVACLPRKTPQFLR